MTEDQSELSPNEIQTRRERNREAMAKWRAKNPTKAREAGRRTMAKRRATKPEEHREYQLAWQTTNPEKMKVYHARKNAKAKAHREANRHTPEGLEKAASAKKYRRAYYLTNRDRELELARNRVAAKKEAIQEYHRAYYLEHKIDYQARGRAWVSKNPDKQRVRLERRRARVAQVENNFTAADWRALVGRSKHCYYCGEPWSKVGRPTHDHIIPISRGGPNTPENSVCACGSCNARKNAQLMNPVTGQGILL